MNEITVKVQTEESQATDGDRWSWKDEANRLDLLASVILATSLAASAAAVAIAAAGGRHTTKVSLFVMAGILLVPTFFALTSLDISASGNRTLEAVARSKRRRVRPALWLLTLTIEVGSLCALLAQSNHFV